MGQAGANEPAEKVGEIEITDEMIDALVRVIDFEMENDGGLGRLGLRDLARTGLEAALSAARLRLNGAASQA